MKFKKLFTRLLTVSVALGLLLAPSMGCAQSGQGPSTDEFFQRFDTDKDDKLSLEEFPGPDRHFPEFDKNSDGFIEKSEMKQVPPPPGKNRQKRG